MNPSDAANRICWEREASLSQFGREVGYSQNAGLLESDSVIKISKLVILTDGIAWS